MQIWANVQPINLDMALKELSETRYEGNLEWNRSPEYTGSTERSAIRCTLQVKSSRGKGHRWNHDFSRRLVAACWHVHRDFMREVFKLDPEARIKTALADYRGSKAFERRFRLTGMSNIGSIAQPCQAREACDCASWGNEYNGPEGE